MTDHFTPAAHVRGVIRGSGQDVQQKVTQLCYTCTNTQACSVEVGIQQAQAMMISNPCLEISDSLVDKFF